MKFFIDFIFNMEGVGNIFFGLIATIIGALLGFFLSRKISREAIDASNKNATAIMRRQEFNKAAAKLRDAFKDEVLALNPALHAIKDDLPVLLKEAFCKHRLAVLDFSYVLDTETKSAFYEAWYKYYCHPEACNENSLEFFEQYSCRGLTIEKQHEMKTTVRDRIKAILSFTEIT